MSIGITGTRNGMTPLQLRTYMGIAAAINQERGTDYNGIGYRTDSATYYHLIHGDCVGADAQAWAIAAGLGWDTTALPSTADPHWHANTPSKNLEPRRPSLDRNKLIVDRCDMLIAFPKENEEARSGGTWYTIRYARTIGRHLVIIWPDGTISEERSDLAPEPDRRADA